MLKEKYQLVGAVLFNSYFIYGNYLLIVDPWFTQDRFSWICGYMIAAGTVSLFLIYKIVASKWFFLSDVVLSYWLAFLFFYPVTLDLGTLGDAIIIFTVGPPLLLIEFLGIRNSWLVFAVFILIGFIYICCNLSLFMQAVSAINSGCIRQPGEPAVKLIRYRSCLSIPVMISLFLTAYRLVDFSDSGMNLLWGISAVPLVIALSFLTYSWIKDGLIEKGSKAGWFDRQICFISSFTLAAYIAVPMLLSESST